MRILPLYCNRSLKCLKRLFIRLVADDVGVPSRFSLALTSYANHLPAHPASFPIVCLAIPQMVEPLVPVRRFDATFVPNLWQRLTEPCWPLVHLDEPRFERCDEAVEMLLVFEGLW